MSVTGPGRGPGSVGGAGFDPADAGVEPDAAEAAHGGKLLSELLQDPQLAAVARGEAELARGARGEGVRRLQLALIETGKLARSPGADGVFGRGTESALAAFQRDERLPPTGKLDARTLLELDARVDRARPAPSPLTRPAASYLETDADRRAYEFVKEKLWTGSSWRRGIDLAVTDDDTLRILDKLETLSPESYNRVLHALAATKESDRWSPTLLDKLVVHGTSQFGHAALSTRFGEQLKRKCEGLGDTPENKILSHISPDSVNRLNTWTGFQKLIDLFA